MYVLEYICIDGDNKFRSKTIFTEKPIEEVECIITDSSMIENSFVSNGDIVLIPVKCIKNPLIKDDSHWLVLCEYKYTNQTNHKNNIRYRLETITQEHKDIKIKATQEFVLFKDGEPLGWDKDVDLIKNYSSSVYYSKFSQYIVDQITNSLLYADIKINSFNMERMVGKWSITLNEMDLLEGSDELYLVRYIIQRICYENNIKVSFTPNPYSTSQIYTRCYFCISNEKMRQPNSLNEIVNACEKLQSKHLEQHKQLCSYNTRKFSYGQNNLKYDVLIVLMNDNSGYIQDRRSSGDCNIYQVLTKIIGTIVVEYNIQTMTYELSELQEKFNYRSTINFSTTKPVIYSNKRSISQNSEPVVEPTQSTKELQKDEAEKKKKKKKEKLTGLTGLARILKMNDDSDNDSDSNETNDENEEKSRVDTIIDTLKQLNLSHNILTSSNAPKTVVTKDSVITNNENVIQNNNMLLNPINEIGENTMQNFQPSYNMQHNVIGQPPPINSLYTLPSQV